MRRSNEADTLTVTDDDGVTWIAWRKEGQRPIVNLDATRRESFGPPLRNLLASPATGAECRSGLPIGEPPGSSRSGFSWPAAS